MKLDEKTLARFYDGELNSKETAEVQALLNASPENSEALQQMERLSNLFQVTTAQQLEDVSFEGFDKRILNEIHAQKEAPSVSERLTVWFKEFFEHRRVVWIPTVSLAGAACAALLAINLQSTSGPSPMMPTTGVSGETWQASASTDATPSSSVTVANADAVNTQAYNIENDNGQRIGVVWIND